jgi:ribose-phosphate pyrophosphokinase
MAEFLTERLQDPILLAPDSEAEQWVAAVAQPNQCVYGVCNKVRSGDRKVEITLPDISLQGRAIVLVDDVASSGQTLAVATEKCLLKDASCVDVLVTHALFGSDVKQRLVQAGVRNIWSTDSVTHESNVIPLKKLLKQAVSSLT